MRIISKFKNFWFSVSSVCFVLSGGLLCLSWGSFLGVDEKSIENGLQVSGKVSFLSFLGVVPPP